MMFQIEYGGVEEMWLNEFCVLLRTRQFGASKS